SDDDNDMDEHRSTNEDVKSNAALDDFIQQNIVKESDLKDSKEGDQANVSTHVASDNETLFSDKAKEEHFVTKEDKPSEEDVSDTKDGHNMFEQSSQKHFIRQDFLRMNLLLADMRNLDQKIYEGLASDEDKSSRISKLQELDYFEKMNSLDLMQKARVKWDVEGDENSKFFHGLINSRRKSQLIHGIMHEGVWLSDPKDIKEAFLNFYKKKFRCHDSEVSFPSFMPAHRLNTSDQDLLEAVVSMEEIKTAVWDCGSNKAPGPDGYSFIFIERFWVLLKHDIQEFVVSFFSWGKFPQGVNSTFITLIPKVSNPLFIKDYRPISLFGLHYKIVAKILSNRLSKVINSIISLEQSAFISGRQILDGPLILSEIIDWYKKRKKKLMLFKVDFEKAFDSVNWKY
nr:putative RNA-directed DNA polymerase, eukaryota [Tanacetum cinerariifolium]